jgi:putative sigma-54 modulation protein
MKLQMHSIRFDADQKLKDYVQKKTDKLERFFDRIIDGEVYLRLDKDENNENKIVEIKINIPGNQLFVKERSSTFEAATDMAVEALKRQLKKTKSKQYAPTR